MKPNLGNKYTAAQSNNETAYHFHTFVCVYDMHMF